MMTKANLCVVLLFCLCGLGFGKPVDVVRPDGLAYRVLVVKPEQVHVVLEDGHGKLLKSFPKALRYLEMQGLEPLGLINGGICEPGHIPTGLVIQEGIERHPLNLKNGKGGFYLKPNGVFFLGTSGTGIEESSVFARRSRKGIVGAIQSGPMLLINGRVHPAFNKQSKWQLHRSGVGIRKDGTLVFIITKPKAKRLPSLYEFAMMFRKERCVSALFLDGDLPRLSWGKEAMGKHINHFASMIAITDTAE